MHEFNPEIKSATAFAPATCANVAVGFDLLGFPIATLGDQVTLTHTEHPGIYIESIESASTLPLDPDKNIASAVIKKFCHAHQLPMHFTLTLKKGIPIGSGMGGSAASAVAALVALNSLLKKPAPLESLAKTAIEGEAMVSGSPHADNVVPCLYGGMTLTRSMDPLHVIQLPIPNLYAVIVHPQLRVDTRDARAVLPAAFPLKIYIQQSANLASFISALYQEDFTLLKTCLTDVLIEPKRSPLIKGFDRVKKSALEHGALGASLSGSGPSVFALAKDALDAKAIQQTMIDAFSAESVKSKGWICKISKKGAAPCNT